VRKAVGGDRWPVVGGAGPASSIKGVICSYRVEEIENPLTRKVRYLDKLVDELGTRWFPTPLRSRYGQAGLQDLWLSCSFSGSVKSGFGPRL